MIGSWERGQRIVLVRNPEFQPRAYLDQVVIRIIPDAVTRVVELRTGAVDFIEAITLDQVPSIRAQAPHVHLVKQEKRFYDYVGYNGSQFAPFADMEIRRALGLALVVPGFIAALLMEEFAVPAGGPYAPIFADIYDPQGQAPLSRDTAAARRTLESKGWRDSNGDGILDRNGQPFSFTLAIAVGNQRRADVAQIAQQQWRQIGVDARIQLVEFNTLSDNLRAGNFQAVLAGWSVALYPDLTALWAPGSPFNFTRYDDPEVTGLINEALLKPTSEQAVPLWRQAATRIVQDQPYTWLYYLDAVGGMNNRVQGARIDTYGPLQNLWQWWIPADQRRAGESGAPGATGSN
jgi:peptide/nickel transport system substrate-binding protein